MQRELEKLVGAGILTKVFRKKRNVTDYERADTVSDAKASELRTVAEVLRRDVEARIRKHHRTLLD